MRTVSFANGDLCASWLPALGFAALIILGTCFVPSAAHAQVDCSATATTGVPQSECEALMALYVSTNGTNWIDNTNWDTASAVSTWFGVVVSGGRVTQLSLGDNQLSGPIPIEIGDLPNLTRLWLQNNQLSGTIPAELGNLANLATFYIWNNLLTGTIPPELGNLASLTSLHLSSNDLTGSIPGELGNLANLTALQLYGNQLSGPIPPELGNLASLTTLHLGNNQLSGPLPIELSNLANLRTLHIYGNQFSGPIPPWLGNLTNLTSLYLGNNQFTGSIPPELGNLTNLVSLFIYGNPISGPIPPELGNLVNLTTLYLPNIQLTGPIPPELGNLSSLDTLFLSNNQLTGPIPPELGNLTNLTTMYLQSNELTGPIPPELGNLSSLDTLYLYGNQLTGPIPPELGNLSGLVSLRVYSNQLTGSIPPELADLANLDTLDVYGNQLSGDIPDFTGLPLTLFRFGGNAFVFADFEPEFVSYNDGAPETFTYSPQARVDTPRTEDFASGSPAMLPSAVAINPSGNDQYQWYKDGLAIAGPYGTARDLDITLGSGSIGPADAGNYHYVITNTVVTGLTLTSETIAVTVSATCGDGFVNDPSEACDDGNLNTGDGCDAACLLEVGEPCAGDADCATNRCNTAAMPAVCAPPVGCGNGLLEAGEACDDGNNTDGDGCTAACELEDGSPCTTDNECASGVCDMNEMPPLCEPAGSCGNGVLDISESCDDGNVIAGDGCSNRCLLEDGEPCTDSAQCESTICDTVEGNTCEPANVCGNGALEAGEGCDDGNVAPGDGCNTECLLELGAGPCIDNAQCESTICDALDSNTCEPANICGNGTREAGEACDDGNIAAGDGCNIECLLELGAGPCTDHAECGSTICNTLAAAPVCAVPLICGNGVLDADEACDDGNLDPSDGCNEVCTLENLWRGGGGCAVERDSDTGDPRWMLGLLLLALVRRRRGSPSSRSR